MTARPERDLYLPVKQFLESRGFTVRAEVEDCDVVAIRGDQMIVVELKSTFSLSLVFQGIDRQTITDYVYLAVPAPQGRKARTQLIDTRRLCSRLGLGLLLVHFFTDNRGTEVEVVRECGVSEPRHNKRRCHLLLQEFTTRSGDFNIGGVARRTNVSRPVVTAYREEALRVAVYLHQQGPTRLRDIRTALGSKKVDSILAKNYYGWFYREELGVYKLSPAGEEGLSMYADVVARQGTSG